DRGIADPQDAAVHALPQVELVTARRGHLGAEYQLIAAGWRRPARTARRLDLRQRIWPEVKLHIAEPDRAAAGEVLLGDPRTLDLGAIAARVVDDVPAAVHELDHRVFRGHRGMQHGDVDPRVAADPAAVGDCVSDAPGIDQ